MSRAYEERQKLEDPNYVPDPLNADDLMALTLPEFLALNKQVLETYVGDSKPSIETEESKKEEGAKAD